MKRWAVYFDDGEYHRAMTNGDPLGYVTAAPRADAIAAAKQRGLGGWHLCGLWVVEVADDNG